MIRKSNTLELVKRAAGAGADVIPWREATLPDIELFWLSTKTAAGKVHGRGIAVVAGKLPWLEGDRAMAALLAAGVSDAPTLARAAIQLLLGRGQLLERPEDHSAPLTPAQKAAITAPAMSGKAPGTLDFCYFAGRAGIQRVRIELTTWKVTATPLDRAVQASQDPIELAKTWLADPGEARAKMGIDKLVAACSDPRAPALLLDSVKTHPRATTRALAAAALATCKPAAAVPTLVGVLAHDPDLEVRKAVVQALGGLADPTARPALEQTAKDDPNPELRSYAEWALSKLPKR